MFGSDNSQMRIPPKKEDVSYVQRGDGVDETKPKKPPANVRKEFKEVLEENDSLAEQEFDKASKKIVGNKPVKGLEEKGQAMSLFDLSRQTLKNTKPLKDTLQKDDIPVEIVGEDPAEAIARLNGEKTKKNAFDPFAQPQADLTFVNPTGNQVQPIEATTVRIEKPEMVASPSPIQDIVEKLLDKLTIIETKGQTDTTMTLNAGTFKGAVVVISQFDSANGQLNIAFENLTQQAQRVLDAQPNRDALLIALSEKGYAVQQFTTTTILEHKPVDIPSSETRFGKPREEREDQPQKEQK